MRTTWFLRTLLRLEFKTAGNAHFRWILSHSRSFAAFLLPSKALIIFTALIGRSLPNRAVNKTAKLFESYRIAHRNPQPDVTYTQYLSQMRLFTTDRLLTKWILKEHMIGYLIQALTFLRNGYVIFERLLKQLFLYIVHSALIRKCGHHQKLYQLIFSARIPRECQKERIGKPMISSGKRSKCNLRYRRLKQGSLRGGENPMI